MAKTKTDETAPAQIVECCIAHTFDLDGVPTTVREGTLLRADNPLALAAPELWCEQGTPHDERPRVDLGKGGVMTTHKPIPSGWRRDWHGGGKPWDQQ